MAFSTEAAKGKEFGFSLRAGSQLTVLYQMLNGLKMNKIAWFALFLGLFYMGESRAQTDSLQVNPQDSVAKDRIRMHQNNMYVLGAWAAANIVQGSISASNTRGSEHFFHQMNAYWNIANLAIAGVGLLRVNQQLRKEWTFASNFREQQQLEKILLLNTGLDFGYLATGLYLRERGVRLNNDRTKGYGGSLILQGGFLLVFDLIQYAGHRRNGKWLDKQLKSMQIAPAPGGLALLYHF